MQIVKRLDATVSLFQIFKELPDKTDCAFLESSLENELGRYSILGLHPYLKVVKGREFTVNGVEQSGSFEDFMKTYLRKNRKENRTHLPITSGAIGYFSYEYGRKKEGVKSRHPREVETPDCVLCFYDDFVIEDLREKSLYLVTNGERKSSVEALSELEEMVRRAREHREEEANGNEKTNCLIQVSPNFTREGYKRAVKDMIRFIVEGDIYIANMTQHLRIKSAKAPLEVYGTLRRENPSPFAGYLDYGDFTILSSSPERFLRVKQGKVETRPIKGTRKRGKTREEDERLKKELAESEKDKSELLMIVDLERNDLNRVCVPGSVKVTELFSIEEYATVFHLTANVTGELREDKTLMDLLEAAFPGGSITGAPKLRAMELIDCLEHGRRNLYTGSLGYLTLDGDCDFNIIIRTALYQGGSYYLGVGGGITYESDLEFEYEETLQKAKALLEAMK